MNVILLAVLCALLTVSGQVLWKIFLNSSNFCFSIVFFRQVLFSWVCWLGFVFYGLATVTWFYGLSRYDLSKIAPMMGGIAYVFSMLFSSCVLGEVLDNNKIIGTFFVIVGVYFLQK